MTVLSYLEFRIIIRPAVFKCGRPADPTEKESVPVDGRSKQVVNEATELARQRQAVVTAELSSLQTVLGPDVLSKCIRQAGSLPAVSHQQPYDE